MKTSEYGKLSIRKEEGFRSVAYQIKQGEFMDKWTYGYGSTTRLNNLPVQKGDTITVEDAIILFERDIARFEVAVNRLVQVPLTQNQFDALVSFVYNLSAGALEKSTLLKKLNAKNYNGAAKEFTKWNKVTDAKGKKVALAGLTARRQREKALFLSEPDDIGNPFANPTPNNIPIPNHKLPVPTAQQELGKPLPPSNVNQGVTIAGAGVAATTAAVTTIDPSVIAEHAPTLISIVNAVKELNPFVALAVISVVSLGGLIWWKWGRR
jgi:lysozyme